MVKSKSSRSWLDEHFKDKYVKDISDSGYRSRASYKLLEMQKKILEKMLEAPGKVLSRNEIGKIINITKKVSMTRNF